MDRKKEREQTIIFLLKSLDHQIVSRDCLVNLIYLVQRYGVDLGYYFEMGYDGVECSSLLETITVMDENGLIDIEDTGQEAGHSIWIDEGMLYLHTFFTDFEHEFTQLLMFFDDFNTLRLYAAMVFVIEWINEHDDSVLTAIKNFAFLATFDDGELVKAYSYLRTIDFGD